VLIYFQHINSLIRIFGEHSLDQVDDIVRGPPQKDVERFPVLVFDCLSPDSLEVLVLYFLMDYLFFKGESLRSIEG